MSHPGLSLAVTVTLCVLQESRSPSGDIPEPRCSAFEPASGGSQEKLDFNRNLKEGGKYSQKWLSPRERDPAPFPALQDCPRAVGWADPWCRAVLMWLSSAPCPCPCPPVMPTIEKLLSSDWKERLLGRNTAESKEVKGGIHLHHWKDRKSVV